METEDMALLTGMVMVDMATGMEVVAVMGLLPLATAFLVMATEATGMVGMAGAQETTTEATVMATATETTVTGMATDKLLQHSTRRRENEVHTRTYTLTHTETTAHRINKQQSEVFS